MKRSKVWKIIWVVGIYALLTTILYLVVLYKVEWEDKDLNTYLYFYDCSDNLCTSTTKMDNYYGKVLCEKDICPYIKEIINNNVILEKNNVSYIYNYINNNIINKSYVNYRYLENGLYVVTDNYGKQGIINEVGDVVTQPMYEYIDNYRNKFISYKQGNFYGIENLENDVKVNAEFDDVVLINDNIYGAKKDGIYKIYYYKDNKSDDTNEYIYLDSYSDIILAINDKKIDIMTVDLKSTLLMKINTFFEYKAEKERDSLNLHSDGEYLYFDVFTSENEYMSYKYNIALKKLV